jgi:hypothetical protein
MKAVQVPSGANSGMPIQNGPGSAEEAASIRKYQNPNYVPIGMVGVFKKADGITVRSDDGRSWYQVDGTNQRLSGGITGTSG